MSLKPSSHELNEANQLQVYLLEVKISQVSRVLLVNAIPLCHSVDFAILVAPIAHASSLHVSGAF